MKATTWLSSNLGNLGYKMTRFNTEKLIIVFLLIPELGNALKCYTCGFNDNKDYCNPDFVWQKTDCQTTAVLGKDEILVCAKTTFVDKRAGNNYCILVNPKSVY